MTVTVRQDVPNTPNTPQRGLLIGNVVLKLNSLTTYLASATSAHVISLHVCLPAQSLLAGRKVMVLWQVALLRPKAVLVISEGCGHAGMPEKVATYLSLFIPNADYPISR